MFPALFLLPRIAFADPNHFQFHTNFKIVLSSSVRKPADNMMEIQLNVFIKFGSIVYPL